MVEWRHVPNNITHTREDDDNVIFSTNNVVAADIYYNLLQQQPLHTTNLKPTFYPLEMTSHVGFLDPQASFTSKADHDVFLSSSNNSLLLTLPNLSSSMCQITQQGFLGFKNIINSYHDHVA